MCATADTGFKDIPTAYMVMSESLGDKPKSGSTAFQPLRAMMLFQSGQYVQCSALPSYLKKKKSQEYIKRYPTEWCVYGTAGAAVITGKPDSAKNNRAGCQRAFLPIAKRAQMWAKTLADTLSML